MARTQSIEWGYGNLTPGEVESVERNRKMCEKWRKTITADSLASIREQYKNGRIARAQERLAGELQRANDLKYSSPVEISEAKKRIIEYEQIELLSLSPIQGKYMLVSDKMKDLIKNLSMDGISNWASWLWNTHLIVNRNGEEYKNRQALSSKYYKIRAKK